MAWYTFYELDRLVLTKILVDQKAKNTEAVKGCFETLKMSTDDSIVDSTTGVRDTLRDSIELHAISL